MSVLENRKSMEDPAQIKAFLLAGNATVTLVSTKTQNRFTFKVEAVETKEGERPGAVSHFVKLLTEPDNERGYKYLGHIYRRDGNFWHGNKSRIDRSSPGARAFQFFYQKVIEGGTSPVIHGLEVWHEGKCGKCGRKLTVPESIERGIGPECYSRIGG
jgi:hypothetical protein